MTPETSDMQAVLERLEKVEKQNRRLKQADLTSLFAGTMALSWGQARHVAFAQDKPGIVSPIIR